jgi:tRNA threonylcarbamoyladenosine biosynthesis protein TsaB
MALILSIDVSGKNGLIVLAQGDSIIDAETNNEPMDHASFLQPAIQSLLKKNNVELKELQAVAISNGPGSYTGLRVGLASAKGLCFALKIPLITINSLQLIARAASLFINSNGPTEGYNANMAIQPGAIAASSNDNDLLYCSMIDARRMEVFFALYDNENNCVINPSTIILDIHFLEELIQSKRVYIAGSGAEKFKEINQHANINFLPQIDSKAALCSLAYTQFQTSTFADLYSVEPFYCKEFYNPSLKSLQ